MPLLGGEEMTRGSDTVDKNSSYSEFTPLQWISADGQHGAIGRRSPVAAPRVRESRDIGR